MTLNGVRRLPFMAAVMVSIGLGSYGPGSTLAEEQPVIFFDLPAQSLSQSLIEFALQARCAILAPSHLLSGTRSTPIVGPFNPDKALQLLLAQSRLQFRLDSQTGIYQILPPAPLPSDPQTQTEVGPYPSPSGQGGSAPLQEDVLVVGKQLPARYTNLASTTWHNGVSLFDSVRSHTLLPDRVFEDTGDAALQNGLQLASGVTPGEGSYGSNDDFYLRGFKRDALHLHEFKLSPSIAYKQDPDMIDSVQIIKGPATLYYGQAEPGGVVNVLRKAPGDELAFSGLYRRYDNQAQKGLVDVTLKPLFESLKSRWLASTQTDDPNDTGYQNSRQSIYGTSIWEPSHRVSLSFNLEYQDSQQQFARDFQVINTLPQSLETLSRRKRTDFQADSLMLQGGLRWHLTDHWHINFQSSWFDETRLGVRGDASLETLFIGLFQLDLMDEDDVSLILSEEIGFNELSRPPEYRIGSGLRLYDEVYFETLTQNRLIVEGRLGGNSGPLHRLLLGIEQTERDKLGFTQLEQLINPDPTFRIGATYFRSLANTLTSMLSSTQPLGPLLSTSQQVIYRDQALFGQITTDWTDDFSTSIGVRASVFEAKGASNQGLGFVRTREEKDQSLQLGVLYRVSDQVNVFSNLSESAILNDEFSSRVDKIGYEKGRQAEAGLKYLSNSGTVSGALSLFRIRKDDLRYLDTNFQTDADKIYVSYDQQVDGIELDASLNPWPGFDLSLSASGLESSVSGAGLDGKYPALVPDYTAAFLARQSVSRDWAVIASGQWVSARALDITNTLNLPEYAFANLAVTKDAHWQAIDLNWRLDLRNLADKRYIIAAKKGKNWLYSEPLRIGLSLTASW
jgi:iron complex outermembrane recepter protein